jgi:hypothetical protein
MLKYNVHVVCTECGQPHFVNVSLELDDETLDRTTLADYFADRPVPSAIAFMRTNKYNCPHTKQLYKADDLEQVLLIRAT